MEHVCVVISDLFVEWPAFYMLFQYWYERNKNRPYPCPCHAVNRLGGVVFTVIFMLDTSV